MSQAALWQGGLVGPKDGTLLWGLGDTLDIRIGSAQSNDRFMFGILTADPNGGPPPHVHSHEDEAFYILNGQMEFLVGDRTYAAPVGSYVYAPRAVVHQYRNVGSQPVDMLFWSTSTNFERFYREIGIPCGGADFVPPAITPELIGPVVAAAERYGIPVRPDASAVGTADLPAGRSLWVLDDHVRILGQGAESNGQLCVVVVESHPNGGLPPHRHADQDEVLYILEGSFVIQLGDRMVNANPGDVVHIPPMTMHRFTNTGTSPGRFVSFHTPAGMEHFFEDCGQPYVAGAARPAPHLNRDQIIAIIERHNMEL